MKVLKNILKLKVLIPVCILLLSISFFYSKKSIYSNETKVYGYIKSYKVVNDYVTFYLSSKEDLVCTYKSSSFNYNLGDYVLLEGSLELPSNNTIFNLFNYKKYLKYEGINYIFNVSSITKLKDNKNIFYGVKNYIMKKINSNINKNYLYTFILGNDDFIDDDVIESYRVNGISHLFSLSGMHISIFTMVILKIFDKCKFKDLIAIVLILFYLSITYSESILRASVMFILFKLNKKLKLPNINIMILTLIIALLIDIHIIFKMGFQYSYLTSLFLVLYSNLIKRYKFKTLVTSLIAFFVTMPITINSFFKVNFLSVILNLIFIPCVSILLFPLTLLSVVLPISNILHKFILVFENFSIFVSKFDVLVIVFPKINILFILIYYIVLLFVLNSILKHTYKNIFLMLFVILLWKYKVYMNPNMIVTYIDVRQGDSTLIQFPYNRGVILIDTGGVKNYIDNTVNERVGENIVSYLNSLGINKIDYLILSHGDYDHMGEAINFVNNFKVDKVIFNCGEFDELEQDLIKVLDKNKIPYYSCIKELNIDDNKLYFLNNKDYGNENDNSSVIYTELNNHKFLFMGDAGVEVEEDLIEKYNLQNIDVLKVGHHGSKTSSSKEFIDKVNPKYSIISVGKNNRYGHPNDSVLENLEGSKIYRTDQDGSIMFRIKNNKLRIETRPP